MIKNILIGVDGSPGSDVARDFAIDLAARLDARLEAVHVVDSRMLEFPLVAPQAGVIGWNPGAVNGLQQALRTRAGYIGMIGSQKKRNAIYAKLMEQGVRQDALQRVHCPIGLAIQAETPEEIAVSIVGELIQQRAFRRKACPPA